MNNRINQIRTCLKMNQSDFGDKIGIGQAGVSAIEKGIRNITDRNIQLICEKFNVNEEWLRTGKGDMFVPLNRTQQIAKLTTDLFKGEKDSFKERLLFALSKLDESDWKVLERIANDLIKEKD